MMVNIYPKKNFVENIGKIIKSSKKSHNWIFYIDKTLCHLVFTNSKFTGNFKIFVNKKFIYNGTNTNENNFLFNFVLQKIKMQIKKIRNDYELYIQGTPFTKIKLTSQTSTPSNDQQ